MSELDFIGQVVEPAIVNQDYLEDLIPVYQTAFAGDPWFEVSKCPAEDLVSRSCMGPYSPIPTGETCESCLKMPVQDAYPADEIRELFVELPQTRPMLWYLEQNGAGQIAMAAFLERLTATQIYEEKYPDVPEMKCWMEEYCIGTQEIGWLDEVFADTELRSRGNLKNFGRMIRMLAAGLEVDRVAYRTLNLRMLGAASRDFDKGLKIFDPALHEVPDRRYFIRIDL